MKVKDIAVRDTKRVVEGTKLRELVNLFVQHKLHSVPVVDTENNVTGVVSIRDILKVMVLSEVHGEGESPSGAAPLDAFEDSMTVEEIMTSNVKVAAEEDPLIKAMTDMYQDNISRMPVVKKGRGLTGMVSQSDVLRAIYKIWGIPKSDK